MKAINYQMKQKTGSFINPTESPEICKYPEYVLRLQKERQIWQNQKLIHFISEKPLLKPIKS